MESDPAARFLSALSGDTMHTFQTFGEASEASKSCNRILHGTLARHAATLKRLNDNGAGVFVMVNRGDKMGRKAANVTAGRALFVDLDGAPIEPVLACDLPPRIVVESSPGKWHAYWPIADLPLGQFTAAQKRLAERFGGDPKVHDRPRVMRLPGFVHRKGEPFLSRLERAECAPYTWDEACRAFNLEARLRLPESIPEGTRNSTLYRLAVSARREGVPQSAQLAKARKVNADRFAPPIADSEVIAVVASAYSGTCEAGMAIPVALLDSEAFQRIDDSARLLAILAYRRANGYNAGIVTLPWSELRPWFRRKDTFHAIRHRVVAAGLLAVHTPSQRAMPRKGRGPKPTFYRLAIGPFGVAYSKSQIGPLGVAPEALQALALEALPSPASANGRPKAKAASDSATGRPA